MGVSLLRAMECSLLSQEVGGPVAVLEILHAHVIHSSIGYLTVWRCPVRVTHLRSTVTTLSVLSVFHAACAAKSGEQASSSAPPCPNYALFVDNTTGSTVRIYRGSSVIAEVSPRSTRTLTIPTAQKVQGYRASLVQPEAPIDQDTKTGSLDLLIRQGDRDQSASLISGVRFRSTCQE
jgi:hypothetical protein